MPLDAVFLTGLTAELGAALSGARIDKVQQPTRDSLLLSVYTRLGARRLLISAAGSGARIHFTEEKYENPDKPPMFCMLMRKHLVGARIDSVTQPPWERMCVCLLYTSSAKAAQHSTERASRVAISFFVICSPFRGSRHIWCRWLQGRLRGPSSGKFVSCTHL